LSWYVPACTGRPKPTNYLMLKGAAAPTLHPVTALRFNGEVTYD
jgi:hypothetical protein